MKTIKNGGAQGDVLIIPVAEIPATAKPSTPENGVHIVTHSETGHHHVIDAGSAQMFIDSTNEFIGYLDVTSDTEFEHLREFDKHESWNIPAGKYEIRRQREYTPEGYRKAAD